VSRSRQPRIAVRTAGWWGSADDRTRSETGKRLVPYDPELIDLFIIMDGTLTMYLIPSRVIAGRVAILLRRYTKYIIGNAAGLMTPQPNAA